MDPWENLLWGERSLKVKTIFIVMLKCCLLFTVLILALVIREAMVGRTTGALEEIKAVLATCSSGHSSSAAVLWP